MIAAPPHASSRSTGPIVLILGSGPNALQARDMPRAAFDAIVTINNAWMVRDDWTHLIFPEDFPPERRPDPAPGRRFVTADAFVPTQNALGGFVYGGGTMAFTAGYWALHALRPRVIAYLGCDMVYPRGGLTHFYGQGTADPLRPDVTLQSLPAKSARLHLIAARQGCRVVNLSRDPSRLVSPRALPDGLRALAARGAPPVPARTTADTEEEKLGHFVESGRYWEQADALDAQALRHIDALWIQAFRGYRRDASTVLAQKTRLLA